MPEPTTRQPTYTLQPTPTRRPSQTPTPTFWATGTRQGRIMTMTPSPADRAKPDTGALQPTATPTPEARSLPPLGQVLRWSVLCAVIPVAGGTGYFAWRRGLIGRVLAYYAAWRSPAERERRALRRERDRRDKERRRILRGLARELARSAREVLTGIGYAHAYRDPGQRRKHFEQITWSHAVLVGEGDQLLLRVGRIPTGCSRWALFDKAPGQGGKPVESGTAVVSWFATELYLALGRQVEIMFLEDIGILFQIGLKQGVAGVPKEVLWKDPDHKRFSMMEGDPLNENKGKMPDADAYPRSRLYIPIGQGRNRSVIRKDLRLLPHLIVSGTTGSGKSNFLNQMICTWLERNTPRTLQLYLVDLKVVEFAHYRALSTDDDAEGLPSMIANVIQAEMEAVAVLRDLYGEIERRQQLMEGVCINIEGWNQRAHDDPDKRILPYIVVIFDELSIVMLSNDKSTRDAAKRFISKTLAVGRAFGVHMILCTQAIQKQIVDLLVTSNTPGKMIFKQATRTASINALGDGRAWTHIEQPGMGFFCDERGGETLVQTPLILESQRDDVIAAELARMTGEANAPPALEYEEICQYALINFDGRMPWEDMWQHFRDRGVTANRLAEWLRSFDGQIVQVNGGRYEQITPSGPRGRRLDLIPAQTETPPAETQTKTDESPENDDQLDLEEYRWYQKLTREER